jgi:hypothetical protein
MMKDLGELLRLEAETCSRRRQCAATTFSPVGKKIVNYVGKRKKNERPCVSWRVESTVMRITLL